MNNEDFKAGFFLGVLTGIVLFSVISAVLSALPWQMRHKFDVEAVERGHAQWLVALDGMVTFEWLVVDACEGGSR